MVVAVCRKCSQAREQILLPLPDLEELLSSWKQAWCWIPDSQLSFRVPQWVTNPLLLLSNIRQKGSPQTHDVGGETEARDSLGLS